MFIAPNLVDLIDRYKTAANVSADSTVSYRIFGDTKKLSALRKGGDLTTARMQSAVDWLKDNWPSGQSFPSDALAPKKEDAA